MRVLFVALDVPVPTDRGQRMRNLSFLRALAAEGHQVSMITFSEADLSMDQKDSLDELCEWVEIIPSPFGGLRAGHLRRLRGLFSKVPYGAWRFRSEVLSQRVERHVATRPCDVIIWDEAYNLENLTQRPTVPVLLNSHDIMQVIWERYRGVERNPVKRLYAWVEYQKLRRWEGRAHYRVDKVLAVSAHDAAILGKLCPGLKIDVVPNTVDVTRYEVAPGDDGRTVLFVGGMDWFPNLDAVQFFAADALPLLRQRAPSVRFAVAGRPPSGRVRLRLEAQGVEFLGRVPDIRPVVAQSAVSVVPLRIGSGIRWKILEAAALGKAMVSTRLGAEGLEFVDGREILLEDAPERLAVAVSTLLADPQRRRLLGEAARRRTEVQYSYEVLRRSLRGALAEYGPVPARLPAGVASLDA